MNNSIETSYKTETGWLCLDFANTASWHASPNPEEKLRSYRDLVSWAKKVGIVTDDTAEAFFTAGEKDPARAREVLEQAIELREAVYRVLPKGARGEAIDGSDISILNTALAGMLPNIKLIKRDGSFAWDWKISAERLDSILWPVVWSATELLTSEALERVGQCADENCGWLFWDSSRNKSRRWCDMQDCGNRAKSRRHYRRSRHNLSAGDS
jgi:predicted RNA-binding Zn ribbon-like protein